MLKTDVGGAHVVDFIGAVPVVYGILSTPHRCRAGMQTMADLLIASPSTLP
jgi:hypothetical protein